MDHMSKVIAKDQLLKKSIILIKAWCTYECSFLGSYAACMATYALYVLILYIINNFAEELATPIDVFRRFLTVWGQFDWEQHIITMYCPIKAANFYERLRNEVSTFTI